MSRASLHKSFIQAVRASGHNQTVLAALAGYAAQSQLSSTLGSKNVALTPKAVERLQRLSAAVGYVGPLFATAVRRA